MTIIGIDPSLTRTAVVRLLDDGTDDWQVVRTRTEWPLTQRLRRLAVSVRQWVYTTDDVQLVLIEEPGFVSVKHASGTEAVQRAIGAILAAMPDVRCELIGVQTIRSALGIRVKRQPGAAKAAVAAWVEAQGITLPRSPRASNVDHDVADAYLLALYGRMVVAQ